MTVLVSEIKKKKVVPNHDNEGGCISSPSCVAKLVMPFSIHDCDPHAFFLSVRNFVLPCAPASVVPHFFLTFFCKNMSVCYVSSSRSRMTSNMIPDLCNFFLQRSDFRSCRLECQTRPLTSYHDISVSYLRTILTITRPIESRQGPPKE